MVCYMVTGYYRGSMYVSDMRVFQDVKSALEYGNTLNSTSQIRVYELTTNNPPKLIKTKKSKTQPDTTELYK